MKVLFMGTPEFSVNTLNRLIEEKYDVCAVFTQPDKPVGRKQILTAPPVKELALSQNIPVFQPASLKENIIPILEELNPDVIVVVAYGKILPENILNFPKCGCINVHASLLPKFRGASPIQWAIVSGEQKTGVTTMLMDKGLDTGDMLLKAEIDILDNDNAKTLSEKLSALGADLLIKTLKNIDKIIPEKQDNSRSSYAPLLNKEMAILDFSKNSREVFDKVRGLYDWPCAYSMLQGRKIKIYSCEIGKNIKGYVSGTLIEQNNELFVVCAENSSIKLLEIQEDGSKKMSAEDYLKGHKVGGLKFEQQE